MTEKRIRGIPKMKADRRENSMNKNTHKNTIERNSQWVKESE